MHHCKNLFFIVTFCTACISGAIAQQPNTLTKVEKQQGWQLLFDGKTFNGWYKLSGGGWSIGDGQLMAEGSDDGKQRDIITNDQFGDFELMLDFKIFNLTNSGIKYLVTNTFPGHENTYLGLEYQILDDINYKYPERGVYRSLASLYDLIPAKKDDAIPLNTWNTARIIVKGNHIEHWLNNKMVVEYDRSSAKFATLVQDSKYKDLQNFGKAKKGYLLLQNEGTPISFRNIRIKPL